MKSISILGFVNVMDFTSGMVKAPSHVQITLCRVQPKKAEFVDTFGRHVLDLFKKP